MFTPDGCSAPVWRPYHQGMVNMMLTMMETDFSGGDLMEVDLVDPAQEMERLTRRALASLENGYEAALETEMLRQHLETCKWQGTALKPALLVTITRVLSAAQF